MLAIVEGRRRREILVLVVARDGWVVRLLRTAVPSSPAPRTRINEGGGDVMIIVLLVNSVIAVERYYVILRWWCTS